MSKVDSLFISPAGMVTSYTKNGDRYKQIEPDGFIIVKNYPYGSKEYIDIFSLSKYKIFSDYHCSPGDLAVTTPQQLTLFIQKKYNTLNQSKILIKIINKIMNNKKVSGTDLKTLLFYLNNPKQLKIDEEKLNQKKLKKKHTNTNKLKIYTDLTKKKYKLNPIIGRDEEMKELMISLIQNNTTPILTGESGVGTTSMIEGLAYKIQKKDVPNFLKKSKIIELSMANLLMSKENNDDKIINLIAYCIKNNTILFIDDIDKIMGFEVWNIINEAIKRRNLKVIGTTNIDNYNKYFSSDDYEKLLIEEPNKTDLFKIMENRFNYYENNYKIYNSFGLVTLSHLIERFIKVENRILNTNNKISNKKLYNPYLVLEIIDTMYDDAIVNKQTKLTRENIIKAFKSCNKIKEEIIDQFVEIAKETKTDGELFERAKSWTDSLKLVNSWGSDLKKR